MGTEVPSSLVGNLRKPGKSGAAGVDFERCQDFTED